MPPESRYKIPAFEFYVNRLIGLIFYYRLPIVTILLGAVVWITTKVYVNSAIPNKFINASAVLTGGSIIIGIFYSIINYEHVYNKGKTDNILSKQILSFNVAFEWHKPNIVEHLKVTKTMYEKHKHLINENRSSEFSELLENDESARASLISIFNYLESVSVGIEFGIMDREVIKKCFKSLFITYFNDYDFYITYRRKKNNCPDAWANFTALALEWRNGN